MDDMEKDQYPWGVFFVVHDSEGNPNDVDAETFLLLVSAGVVVPDDGSQLVATMTAINETFIEMMQDRRNFDSEGGELS